MKISKKISVFISVIFISGLIMLIMRNNKSEENEIIKSQNSNQTVSEESNITKSGIDIITADYREFYDDLTPYGDWIKIKPQDIGIEPEKTTETNNKIGLLNKILGIQDALADTYVSWDFFFIWRPSPSLSIGVAAGEPGPSYVPYVNGRWIYSENGWYFKAPTYYEEIVHHYGRWCYTGSYGWIWIPGRVWAPAWVRWAEDDDYIGWAPVETSFYIYNQYYVVPQPVYTFVSIEKKHFLEPEPYKYFRVNKFNYDFSSYAKYKIHNGPEFRNNSMVNRGPDIGRIEKVYGKKITPFDTKKLINAGNPKSVKGKYDVVKTKTERKQFADNKLNLKSGKNKDRLPDKSTTKNNIKKNSRDKSFDKNRITKQRDNTFGIKKFSNPEKNIKQKNDRRKEVKSNKRNNNSGPNKEPVSPQNKKERLKSDNGRGKKNH